jgi:FHA domain-containing protein
VTGTIVCTVCGTVNVGVFARCIACGQELARDVEPASEETQAPEAPLAFAEDPTIAPGLSGASLAASPAAAPPTRPRSQSPQASEASEELDSAAFRQTVIEMPKTGKTEQVRIDKIAAAVAQERRQPAKPAPQERPAVREEPTGAHPAAGEDAEARFVARLLLPEGDRRAAEIGRRGLVLGSGLDELGLSGDPKAAGSEARLYCADGKLWLEPAPTAQNVYRRIDREVRLCDGDVVLMGDVAATFESVGPGRPVDGTRQVLGGSANAPCGRLVFLRKDGSPGPVHDLPAGKTVVGRTDGHLNFPNDSRLSRRHALFFASDQGVTVEDMDSRNGTYLRVRERTELRADDALRIGSAGVQIRTKG